MRQHPFKIKKLVDFDYFLRTSPYVLIWALFYSRSTSMQKLRFYFAKLFWRNFSSLSRKRKIRVLLHFITWPYNFFRNIQTLGVTPYERVKEITGKSKSRQVIEQLYQAIFFSASAQEYFMYEFFERANAKKIRHYYKRWMFKPLLYEFMEEVNYPRSSDTSIQNLDSKFAFDETCQIHGLECIPLFGIIGFEKEQLFRDIDTIKNSKALFFKPVTANVGRGAEMWIKQGNLFINDADKRLSFEQLLNRFKTYESDSFHPDFIMQPRITNHKVLDFGTKALSTVRIVTFLIEKKAEAPFGILRFSTHPDAIIDNFHAGGYATKIDMRTGELGYASDIGDKKPGVWLEKHPLNQKQIKGLILPFWKETKALALSAHKTAFPKMVCIGWDIAITNHGPVLVEGNIQPDNEAIQKNHKGLGYFSALDHLAEKIANDYNLIYGKNSTIRKKQLS